MPSHSNKMKTAKGAHDLIKKIQHVDRKFRRARKQILVLNSQIESLLVRYQRSSDQGQKAFRCATRLQVTTVEGVRDMFYEYARLQCQDMDDLQCKLKQLTGEEYDDFEDFEWSCQIVHGYSAFCANLAVY